MIERDLYLSEEQLRIYRIKKVFSQIAIYLFLIIIAIIIIVPFYWMVATALRTTNELAQTRVGFLPADTFKFWEWQWRNFPEAFSFARERGTEFIRLYLNTIFVGFATTTLTMVTTILASFAFARLNFKFREPLFALFLATMMIPGEIFVISNYATVTAFGWVNSYTALIVPFIVSVFYVFFLRQTFKQIPNELYLAAKVDGTGDFKYLWKVMIPLAKATLTTIFILSVMGTWNAYIWPNLVARADHLRLVSNGLLTIYSDPEGLGEIINLQMAAATLITIPLLIAFIFLKKYIMRGVSRSGIKG